MDVELIELSPERRFKMPNLMIGVFVRDSDTPLALFTTDDDAQGYAKLVHTLHSGLVIDVIRVKLATVAR